jgi:hypothetical protein
MTIIKRASPPNPPAITQRVAGLVLKNPKRIPSRRNTG